MTNEFFPVNLALYKKQVTGANMKFTIKHGIIESQSRAALIVGIFEKNTLSPSAKRLDKASGGHLTKLLKKCDFQAKIGDTLLLPELPKHAAGAVLLVGCGKNSPISQRDYRKMIAVGIKGLQATHATQIINCLPELDIVDQTVATNIQQAAEITAGALYRYDHYKSVKQTVPKVKEIAFYTPEKKSLETCKKALSQATAISGGVSFTKDLANTPSNICTPTYLADQAKKLARQYPKLTAKVLEEKDMKRLGMGAFLAVSKGSAEPAKLVCLEYKGATKKQDPVVLVGKGITFDTGGISLKPSESMVGMKYDMCGAATVLGTLKAIADLKLPIHVVGLLAIAENMPGGKASKPEDIVTTMSGQTVEILNTDAEGRLVLCDALTYAERYKPSVVIDIATLTGAVVVALGHHATGLLSNNDKLATDLLAAGEESHDRAWQLPLWEEYQEQIRTPFADMANTGGRGAGTITAACFLSRYAKKFAWAHLDVAGTAAMMGGVDRYATGRPVPLLTQFLINRSKTKRS
jgi:leucyl aminopeptidase